MTRFHLPYLLFFDGRVIMDIKRTILIVALAVVFHAMVLKRNQWTTVKLLCRPQNVAASSTTAPALPDTVPGNNASNSADVPSASADTSTVTETPVAASKDLIHVKPTFWILQRIHRVVTSPSCSPPIRLPDHPDVPFQLFDNGNERTYFGNVPDRRRRS